MNIWYKTKYKSSKQRLIFSFLAWFFGLEVLKVEAKRTVVREFQALVLINQKMVGLNGLEPSTSPLSGVCSNHLSYKPIFLPRSLSTKQVKD